MTRKLLALVALSLLPLSAQSHRVQLEPLTKVPEARWKRMFSGVNVGNIFLTSGNLEKQREAIDTAEMQIMRQMGIKNVRVPFLPETVTTTYSPVVFDRERLDFFKKVLRDFARQGILVQIDLHDGTRLTRGMGESTEPVRKLREFWRALAWELRDLDPDMLVISPLSEAVVQDNDLWWSIQKSIIGDIRASMPQHTIIAEAAKYSLIDELKARAPYPDPNVIYAFHYYEPFIFTHQGAKWVSNEQGNWTGVRYPSTPQNVERLKPQITSPNKQRSFDELVKAPWNRARIRNRIKEMADWAQRYDVKVICNEFGTVRETIDPQSRKAWLRDVRDAFEEFNIGWAVYEWRGGMGMHYGRITNPGAKDTVDWGFIDALGWRRPRLR